MADKCQLLFVEACTRAPRSSSEVKTTTVPRSHCRISRCVPSPTGHLTLERALEVGERIDISGALGIVRAVEPLLGEREFRLVVQLLREGVAF